MSALTFKTILQRRADQHPERNAYVFQNWPGATVSISYAELNRAACAIAAALLERRATGERALLLYGPGLDYVAALFGCFYAGVIAVPVHPPTGSRRHERVQLIAADAQARFVLTCSVDLSNRARLAGDVAGLQALEWIGTAELDALAGGAAPAANVGDDSVALLQYTSGSSGSPKGVVLTHRNLVANSNIIRQCFDVTSDDRGVIWLPPYHDMGLIGGILTPMFAGCECLLLSPVQFLKHPLLWLKAISEFGGTCSGGPNFAFDLCVNRATEERLRTLDLRRWRVAFTGAEQIRANTLDRFAQLFARCGFRKAAFTPCYGLAEATLMVSGSRSAQGPTAKSFVRSALEKNVAVAAGPVSPGTQHLVSCGRPPSSSCEIRVVDPETSVSLPDKRVGEVWVRGPSVAAGYFRRSLDTKLTFNGFDEKTGDGPFLRTGDLGFLDDGDLYITGRRKDLIILGGRNHYPEDIEHTIGELDLTHRSMGTAVFAVDSDGHERVVIVHEIDARRGASSSLTDIIRLAIATEHGVGVHEVVFVSPGSIPRTSSNKVRRSACRTAFLTGTLERVAHADSGAREPKSDDPAITMRGQP